MEHAAADVVVWDEHGNAYGRWFSVESVRQKQKTYAYRRVPWKTMRIGSVKQLILKVTE